jgi:hypothetical protein
MSNPVPDPKSLKSLFPVSNPISVLSTGTDPPELSVSFNVNKPKSSSSKSPADPVLVSFKSLRVNPLPPP